MSAVLDASAIIAIVNGEPGASAAANAAAVDVLVTAINLGEAQDRLVRSLRDRDRVVAALDALVSGGLRVVSCDRELASEAADLRSSHYHRRDCPISLADCFAIAAAARLGSTLVSSDADQVRIATRAGVAVHPIPNSRGVIPQV